VGGEIPFSRPLPAFLARHLFAEPNIPRLPIGLPQTGRKPLTQLQEFVSTVNPPGMKGVMDWLTQLDLFPQLIRDFSYVRNFYGKTL
jgi:hypothetical protein